MFDSSEIKDEELPSRRAFMRVSQATSRRILFLAEMKLKKAQNGINT